MNLIIDGNYFGYRTLHVSRLLSESKFYLADIQEQAQFIKKLKIDFLSELKKFNNVESVIFTLDSHSWRKEFLKVYKQTRNETRSNSDIDYKSFYKLLSDFGTYLSENFDVVKTQVQDLEGDDVIYFWSEHFLNNNKNSVIITSDKDLNQLTRKKDNNFCFVFNNHSQNRRYIIDEDCKAYLDEKGKTLPKTSSGNDIFTFNLSESLSDEWSEISKHIGKNLSLEVCNKNELLFDKIFMGDGSDEIPNVFSVVSEDCNCKIKKFTRNHLKWIKKILDDNFMVWDITQINKNKKMLDVCVSIFSDKIGIQSEDLLQKIRDVIVLNHKLIVLNQENIPEEPLANWYKYYEENKIIPKVKIQELLKMDTSEMIKSITGYIEPEVEAKSNGIEMFFKF
jgi:hypothetical protein